MASNDAQTHLLLASCLLIGCLSFLVAAGIRRRFVRSALLSHFSFSTLSLFHSTKTKQCHKILAKRGEWKRATRLIDTYKYICEMRSRRHRRHRRAVRSIEKCSFTRSEQINSNRKIYNFISVSLDMKMSHVAHFVCENLCVNSLSKPFFFIISILNFIIHRQGWVGEYDVD